MTGVEAAFPYTIGGILLKLQSDTQARNFLSVITLRGGEIPILDKVFGS